MKNTNFEIDLRPGTFCCSAAMLTPGHTSPPATKHKETINGLKKKKKCVHAQLGQMLDQKVQRQKAHLSLLKSQEQTQIVGNKSRYWYVPTCAFNTTKGWAKHLSHPSSWTPGHTPTLTPDKEVPSPSILASRQANLLLALAPSCNQWPKSPDKALTDFLVWPLVNFYSLGKAKKPGQYQFEKDSLRWGTK